MASGLHGHERMGLSELIDGSVNAVSSGERKAMHACKLGSMWVQQECDGSACRSLKASLAGLFLMVLLFLVQGCESPPWHCVFAYVWV